MLPTQTFVLGLTRENPMSFKTPSIDQVRALGDSLGMEVTEDYAKSFINFIQPFGDGYRLLASLPDDVPAIKHLRGAYYRPEGDENKYGAWIVKTHIKGASGGKLAGKKVAVKDTYAVAGVPLTNGASVLEERIVSTTACAPSTIRLWSRCLLSAAFHSASARART
jgi:amidase